jgi:hypothetical protein
MLAFLKIIWARLKDFIKNYTGIFIIIIIALFLFKPLNKIWDNFFPDKSNSNKLEIFTVDKDRKVKINEKDENGIIQIPIIIGTIDKKEIPEGIKKSEISSVTEIKIEATGAKNKNKDEYDNIDFKIKELKQKNKESKERIKKIQNYDIN